MSRIGLTPVAVPSGVTIEIGDQVLKAKGKLGELSLPLVDEVEASVEDNELWIKPRDESLRARKLWGTFRSLAGNMVEGVSEGFKRQLEINGVGYRANMEGKTLVLQLGYSHDVRYPVPEGITITCETQTEITVAGADKQLVGSVASDIRGFRPPEPYKGKGVKYKEEQILRKEGKKK
jgi:large subunit ribosomal protein L6